jgi:hypothetical protein
MTTKTSFRRDDVAANTSGAEAARKRMIQTSAAISRGEPLPRFDDASKPIRSAADARKLMLQRGA